MTKVSTYKKTETSYHEAGHILMSFLHGGYTQRSWIYFDKERNQWFGKCKTTNRYKSPFYDLFLHSAGILAASMRFPNTDHLKRSIQVDDIELIKAHEKDKTLNMEKIYETTVSALKQFWPLVKQIALKLKDEELLRKDEIEEMVGMYFSIHKIKFNQFKNIQEWLINLNEEYIQSVKGK